LLSKSHFTGGLKKEKLLVKNITFLLAMFSLILLMNLKRVFARPVANDSGARSAADFFMKRSDRRNLDLSYGKSRLGSRFAPGVQR
jgi:hypothetical protein